MRTQQALLSTAWLILGLLLTAGESPSERIVSKYSSTARAKSISFQETGEKAIQDSRVVPGIRRLQARVCRRRRALVDQYQIRQTNGGSLFGNNACERRHFSA